MTARLSLGRPAQLGDARGTPVPGSAAADRRAKPTYRADLQGLRALASLLVAIYHTWYGTVSGGVDVFFVLTGMLMTATLVGNIERSGGVDPRRYLTRLASRLLPLAGLVLAAIAVFVVLVNPQFQWSTNFRDLFAAATYWENWHLANQATDYLAQGTAKSPVQHFWAMSVQGQFYLIWAALLALAVLLARIVKRVSLTGWITTIVVVASAASAAWALSSVATNPVFAYYDTWARLWEFGIGALVFLAMRGRQLGPRVRAVAGIAGLAVLLTAGLAPTEWPYPGAVALWPVTGAVLIVLSHQADAPLPGPVTRLLGSRPLEWLGNYSYGLYLWSWPMLIAYFALFPDRERATLIGGVMCIGLAIVAAWASIRGLEKLQAAWRSRGIPRWRDLRVPIAAALVPAVAIVALVVPIAQKAVLEARFNDEGGSAASSFGSVAELQAEIDESLAATSLPLAYPGFGEEGRAREWVEDGCATVTPETLDECRFDGGSAAAPEIMVIGDSQATSWVPGIRAATGGEATVQVLTREMCPWSSIDVTNEWQGIDAQAACTEHREWVTQLIAERQPDLVILSFGIWHADRVTEEENPTASMQLLAQGARQPLEDLMATGAPVTWLDSPPTGLNIDLCGRANTPELFAQYCRAPVLLEQLVRVSLFTDLSIDVGIRYIDTLNWFCDHETLECPGFMRDMAVQADGAHLTWGMAQALAPMLERTLRLDELPYLGT